MTGSLHLYSVIWLTFCLAFFFSHHRKTCLFCLIQISLYFKSSGVIKSSLNFSTKLIKVFLSSQEIKISFSEKHEYNVHLLSNFIIKQKYYEFKKLSMESTAEKKRLKIPK